MLKFVTKADGRTERYDPIKQERWIAWADKQGNLGAHISKGVYDRLEDYDTTDAIHQKMIAFCLEQEKVEYSRVAAYLEQATILKSAERIGLDGISIFDLQESMDRLFELGLWAEEVIPEYNPEWEDWLAELLIYPLEFWTVKQWQDKYGIKYKGECIEPIQLGALGLGLALHGDTEKAFELARAIVTGKANLPTPVLNGCRNGDFDSISCCVISTNDTVGSIGTGIDIAYQMTAKKAGIGVEFNTRSKGAPVKGGRVEHLGKHGIYSTVDKSVKMFTQVTRGGSATVTYKAIDPDIMEMLLWKTQRVDIEQRIDKLDYSFAFNDSFVGAVIRDEDWLLFDRALAPEVHTAFLGDKDTYAAAVETNRAKASGSIKARELLKRFLMSRSETGRVYCINLSRVNSHTPFTDPIVQSNLCMEINLPTKGYIDGADLHTNNVDNRAIMAFLEVNLGNSENDEFIKEHVRANYKMDDRSEGETAFCALAAIVAGKVSFAEYPAMAKLMVDTVNVMIDKAPALTPSMRESIKRRRSIGIGITDLAGYLYREGLDYDGSQESFEAVSKLAEYHYYYLLKASQDLAEETGEYVKEGIDLNWLPIDTAVQNYTPELDWEALRGKKRYNSVLVAHMPTESSAVFSGAINGLYPPRTRVIYKKARRGNVQFIVGKDDFITAWDVDTRHMARYYGLVADFSDQGISADTWLVPESFEGGKVPLTTLMTYWLSHFLNGTKTMYYQNTKDTEAKTPQERIAEANAEEDEGCEGGCKL
ncbi:putative ribonucleoside-diphosphate reductase [Vibrio phage 70E35.6]|nr:putative ribonucleoside-diphosphate reductase [Vibrio phage 70E35.6]